MIQEIEGRIALKHMDENTFMTRMNELIALGKKKKGVLEYKEIMDFLGDIELDAEAIDKVYETLESCEIDVLGNIDLEEVAEIEEAADDIVKSDIDLDALEGSANRRGKLQEKLLSLSFTIMTPCSLQVGTGVPEKQTAAFFVHRRENFDSSENVSRI